MDGNYAMNEIKAAIEAAIERHDETRRARLAELATGMSAVAEKVRQTGEAAKRATRQFDGFLAILDEADWDKVDWQKPVWTQDPWPNPWHYLTGEKCYCRDPSCTRIPHRPFIVSEAN